MTADTMGEKVEQFAQLAQKRAKERDKEIEDIVHELTHESYLSKHTTEDVLKELQELQSTYPDEFYNGDANDHLMEYLENPPDFEYWHDFAYLSLAAGLEWAVLQSIDKPAEPA